MTRIQLLSVITINLILLPVMQLSYNLFFITTIAESMFQLLLFPLLILLLNLALWCCRLKIASSIHWIFIYVGQGTALACYFVLHYWQLEPYPDMPPGEAAFDLCMITFFIGVWQLVALLLVNVSTLVITKIGLSLKKLDRIKSHC